MDTNTKKCSRCGIVKELHLFYKDSSRSKGVHSHCKECQKITKQAWHDRNPKAQKAHRIKHNYGITLEEYENAMRTSEVCEICGSKDKLCYDHDHITGVFRGVLCAKCNKGLGLLGDNRESVLKTLNYLSRHI